MHELTEYIDIEQLDSNFVKEEYREGQRECLEFIINAFNNGKKIVIIECPTGGGKSAIGMTMAEMVNRSYYLTITKILQDQLTNDFGDQIVELKGKASYPCTYWNRFGKKLVNNNIISAEELEDRRIKNDNCAAGACKTKHNKGKYNSKCPECFPVDGIYKGGTLQKLSYGKYYSECPYYEQVGLAQNRRKVTMNFSSFLHQTQYTQRFDKRDLLIIDEAHNTEPCLLDFVSLEISDFKLRLHGIKIPELDTPYEYADWFEDVEIHKILHNAIRQAEIDEDYKTSESLTRLVEKYKVFKEQIRNDNVEWICEFENNKAYNIVRLKPIYATDFAHPLLFSYAPRILMMSATILNVNVMCSSLGIDKKHVAAYRMDNKFPVENRPIYLSTVAKMTGGKSRMHEWMPPMLDKIEELLDKHEGQKGIIHTHNFNIHDSIIENISEKHKDRLLSQKAFSSKQVMLDVHAKSNDSVIVAPAMHEGIDLIGDLSRFQILCKVPYPNCFDDKQLAKRVEHDRDYYMWLVCLKIVQSVGRSIRSPEDYADTYILDSSIYGLVNQYSNMLPKWFTEALK